MRNRPQLIYYHGTYLRTCIFDLLVLVCIRFFLRYELIIVDHDCRHLHQKGKWYKKLYRWIAYKVNRIICIGDSTYKSYQLNGIEPSAIVVESSFIPPVKRTAPAIWTTYPSSLTIFMQEHTPLFLLSAAHLMLIEGKDIYGIDITIAMLA